MRWTSDEVLLTQDAGEFAFIDAATFEDFTSCRLAPSSALYRELKSKHFLLDSNSTVPLELLATKYRTKKSFLNGFTRLHIFVVTLRCDHSCAYCQVSRVTQDRSRYDMTRETAERAIKLMFRSPAIELKVEFQGGEPLLNFELIRWLIECIRKRNLTEGRSLQFVVATNLALLSDEMLAFFADHSVCLSTSLDGPRFLHNSNRFRPSGNSHELTIENLVRARAVLGRNAVAALMTTTELSLQHPREIIDEYVRLGFDSVFLRSISPYGFAARTGMASRYQAEEFLEFYRTSLEYIVELNRRGLPFIEVYTQILLQKMLTPFPTGYVDLQSPTGAGIGAVVYNYDGDVYASDEGRMLAEMGDKSFHLGNIHRDSYEAIFGGPTLRALVENSCSETLPGCSECAFVPYCGADPVLNWATQRDPIGHRPTSSFCAKNMGMLRHLFKLLRDGDDFTRELFVSWATQQARETPEAAPV